MKNKNIGMNISERELNSLTRDMIDGHEDTRAATTLASAEWNETYGQGALGTTGVLSRRRLLGVGGAAAAGLVVAGCGSTSTAVMHHHKKPSSVSVDVKVAALAASLENLAVATYAAGLKAATAGKLGAVPPAVATFATTAMAQHKDHAAVWNNTLSSAGYAKVTKPDPVEAQKVNTAFASVKDVVGLAQLALLLEGVAAATYLEGLSVVSSPQARQTAASIHPVEMQHVAILRFVLGENPVPSAFASMALARPVADNPYL